MPCNSMSDIEYSVITSDIIKSFYCNIFLKKMMVNTRGVQYVMKTAQYIPMFYIYTLPNYIH